MLEINKYSDLNDEQKSYIILGLALKKEFAEIKQNFERLFEAKIKGEVLINIDKKFKDKIDELAEKELNDINRSPLAHSRIRLEFIYKGLQEASSPKPVRSIRTGEREYETIYEIDHAAIAKYLSLAQNEEIFAKKLYFEILKNRDIIGSDKPKSGFKPIQINSGLTWDEISVDS